MKAMRVLLVEDDIQTADLVTNGLGRMGIDVIHAADGASGLEQAQKTEFDAAIVDIMLPRMNGLELIRNLRTDRNAVPIIVLSAKGQVQDRIEGLESGADDYLTKPFAVSELVARLQALSRRREGAYQDSDTLRIDDLEVTLSTHKVTRAGERIELQPKEFALLVYLMRNAGRVVSKHMIIDQVWDYNFDPTSNIVEARICCLRDKIDRNRDKKLIRTVRGVGYMVSDED
jgi:two-component system OmpR family response regulator